MALVKELTSTTFSTSGSISSKGVLWPTLGRFRCHRDDEVTLHGAITGNPVPPFTCCFSSGDFYSHILAVADEEGSLRLLNTRKSATQFLVKEISAHRNAIFDLSWKPGGEHIVTASGDMTISEWDVVRGELVATYKSHTGSVKSVDVKNDEPTMLVSGGRDGSIYVWDTRCSSRGSRYRPVNHVRMAHKWTRTSPPAKRKRYSISNPTDLQYAVTSVLFHGSNKVASCGAADGSVKLWDLRRTYSICKSEPPPSWHSFSPTGEPGRRFGFTALVADPWQSTLFASCTNNVIYQYSTSLLKPDPVGAYGGHTGSSFFVKSAVSPEGNFLLSGSCCGHAFIWCIDDPKQPPIVLSGHSKEVTAVSWSPALTEIVTCSDNNDLRIWRIGNGTTHDIVGTAAIYEGQDHNRVRDDVQQQKVTSKLPRIKKTLTNLNTRAASTHLAENTQSVGMTSASESMMMASRKITRTSRTHPLQLHNYFSQT